MAELVFPGSKASTWPGEEGEHHLDTVLAGRYGCLTPGLRPSCPSQLPPHQQGGGWWPRAGVGEGTPGW